MKTKEDYIKEIIVNKGNIEHILETRSINGTLLLEIKRVMQEYSDQQLTEYKLKIQDLLLFCEPNGEVKNGFKSKEAIQSLIALINGISQ